MMRMNISNPIRKIAKAGISVGNDLKINAYSKHPAINVIILTAAVGKFNSITIFLTRKIMVIAKIKSSDVVAQYTS